MLGEIAVLLLAFIVPFSVAVGKCPSDIVVSDTADLQYGELQAVSHRLQW